MKTKYILGASTLILALVTNAHAQNLADDEIIVTATKRAESIQDVPISISAYGSEFIEKSGVTDIRDVALYSPNFTISNSSQMTNTRIAIRGVGSVGNAAIEPSAGVFIDGVYYPRPGSVIGNLMDIDTFEVLRGPQGTLFGRNTPTGALNIRTKDPSLNGYEGSYELGYGNYNAVKVGAALNIPLGENVAARISGKYTERDGYSTNTLTGEDFGDRDDLNLRAKVLFEPSDNIQFKLTGDYSKINSTGQIIAYVEETNSPAMIATLNALMSLDPSLAGRNANLMLDGELNHDAYQVHGDNLADEQWGISADFTYEMDSGHELRVIGAMRDWEANYYETPIRLPMEIFPRKTDYDNETQSLEVQFLSPSGGAFDYIVGGFYYNEDYYISQDFDLGTEFCNPIVLGVTASLAVANACDSAQQIDASDGEFDQDLESVAVFGQASWHPSENLSFTGGLRYTKDDKTADMTNTVNNPFVIALAVRANESHLGLDNGEFGYDTDSITYFANVSYDISPDIMVFATTSTGYKSGGFNSDGVFEPRAATDPDFAQFGNGQTREQRIFGPEDTTNYELGFKSTLMDGALQLNATLFQMDIEGFQDRPFDGISFKTRNVGELQQRGLEADANFRPTDQLSFIGGLSYLDSEFKDYRNASPLPGGAVQDLTGERAHFSPKWQYSLVSDWTDNVNWFGGGEYFLRGETQFIGEQNIGANTNQNPQSVQEGYNLFNARIGFRSENGWEIGLWGKNLTNEAYCLTMFDQPFVAQLGGLDAVNNTAPQRCAVGAPKTYGIEFKYKH